MTRQKLLIVAGITLAALLFVRVSYIQILRNFLKTWEGFSSRPYWDVKQWSWGHGTRVPGSIADPTKNPGGRITRAEAMNELVRHTNNDYLNLRPDVTATLSPNQWAAFLSFSYNLGPGNARNLLPNINTGNIKALREQWAEYIYANRVVNEYQVKRRAAEWELFMT